MTARPRPHPDPPACFDSVDRIDLLVSFLKWSGWRLRHPMPVELFAGMKAATG